MKKMGFLTLSYCFICSAVFAQVENKVIFNNDKNIPAYYVFSDHADNTFYRNGITDDVTSHLKTILKLNNETTLELSDTLTDIAGGFHETYQQYYKGIEVDGKQCSVHYASDGQVKMINGNLWTVEHLDIIPAKKKEEAKVLATEAIKNELQRQGKNNPSEIWESINFDSVASYKQANLVVYIKNDSPYLAYKYMLSSMIVELNQCVYIDANNGDVLDMYSTVCSISTTAQSLYSGIVPIETQYYSGTYRLKDTTRGNGIITISSVGSDYTSSNNTWSNLSNYDRAAIDVHWGVEKTYDFYLSKFGRNSYDNQGSVILSKVNEPNYPNACWTGSYIVYGRWTNDLAMGSLDVTAHELTHGFTQSSSNLNYTNESGAINEGISDVFGICAEKENKPYKPESAIWQIGEDFITGGLRDISNPDCKYYHGTGWISSNYDNGGVHTNSGVFSYWFYLLVKGGNATNEGGFHYTVDSIGFEKAIQICYLANYTFLKSDHQFKDARYCTLYAAQALNYGTNVMNQVCNAWDAVGVYDGILGSNFVFNTEDYWITSVPDTCSVNWFLTGDNAANFIVENDTPSHNECRITRITNAEFSGYTDLTLSAQIMHGGSVISTVSKELIAPFIEGPMVPCGTTFYYVDPLPANHTVEWEADGQNLGYDNVQSGSIPANLYPYVIDHQQNERHYGTLTATVKSGNTVVGTLVKQIDTAGGFSGTWYQQPSLTDSTNVVPQPFTHQSSLPIVPERTVYLVSDDFQNSTITHIGNGFLLMNWYNSNGVISFIPVPPVNTPPGQILFENINGRSADGCRSFSFQIIRAPQLSLPFTLFATPSEGSCQFSLSANEEGKPSADERLEISKEWHLTVTRSDTGSVVHESSVSGTSKTIGNSGWEPGIYIATAQVNGQNVSCKFVVSK